MNTNELQDPGAPDSPGDPATFEQHNYDSRGVARVYQMSLEGGIWKLWREHPGSLLYQPTSCSASARGSAAGRASASNR